MPAPSGRFFSGPKGRSDRQNVLMVEGQDDAVFVDTLLFLVGAAPERVGVVYIEGKTKLEINVADLIKSRPFVTGQIRKYAIILDSDQAPEQTLAEAHRALTANGQPTPAHGVFREDAKGVAVGVFLIPSDVEAGDLEKLCLATLGTDGLLTMARNFLAQVNQDFGPLPAQHKSLAQIYLACRKEDTRGVGQAFRDGIFIQHHACLAPIKDFLRAFSI